MSVQVFIDFTQFGSLRGLWAAFFVFGLKRSTFNLQQE